LLVGVNGHHLLFQKRKDLLKEKLPTLITFKYNEKRWLTTDDQMAGRSLGQKPQCSSDESEEGESWFIILSRVT
jgi:hypothetical protein